MGINTVDNTKLTGDQLQKVKVEIAGAKFEWWIDNALDKCMFLVQSFDLGWRHDSSSA